MSPRRVSPYRVFPWALLLAWIAFTGLATVEHASVAHPEVRVMFLYWLVRIGGFMLLGGALLFGVIRWIAWARSTNIAYNTKDKNAITK